MLRLYASLGGAQMGQHSDMRDKVISAITLAAIVILAIADTEGVAGRRIVAVLAVLWLVFVAAPWILSELPPPWRRRAL